MKTKVLFSCAALVAIVSSVGADVKSDWQKILDNYCSIAKKKDLKNAEKIVRANFSKDFTFLDMKGKATDLNTWIKQGNEEMKMAKSVKQFSIHIDSSKTNGNTTEMSTTITMAMTFEPDKKAKESEMKYVGKSAMTLKKINSKWLLTRIIEKSSTVTVDGKPVKM